MGKHEGNRQLGRSRSRWQDNIEINSRKGMEYWTGLMVIRIGRGSWFYRGGDRVLGCVTCRKFLGQLKNC